MAERGLVGASFVSLPQPRGSPLHTAILDYSLEHDADIVVVRQKTRKGKDGFVVDWCHGLV